MSNSITNRIINEVAAKIDIPDSAYETAERRYKDLGEWFGRKEANCFPFDPHIYPQGSFRLGTVISPLNPDDEYDLDLGCRLRSGISKATHTQKQLKDLVGADLEGYQVARGIKEKKEEKHRCWRLKYADALNFHIDTVPSIPESAARRQSIQEAMVKAATTDALAKLVAGSAGAITDNALKNYDIISDDWRISNSEGFARWFESRMKLARLLLEKRAFEAKAAQVDDLPAYRWKSPLQRCVQILKRHRDVIYADNLDSKPTSIIITTLAGKAYQGEVEIADALDRILSNMGSLINPTMPRVPNPVNPAEDFADKWANPNYHHLELEKNFRLWLEQAKADFDIITSSQDKDFIAEQAMRKFGARLDEKALGGITGAAPGVITSPKSYEIAGAGKPWQR